MATRAVQYRLAEDAIGMAYRLAFPIGLAPLAERKADSAGAESFRRQASATR